METEERNESPLFILIFLCWYHVLKFSSAPASFAIVAIRSPHFGNQTSSQMFLTLLCNIFSFFVLMFVGKFNYSWLATWCLTTPFDLDDNSFCLQSRLCLDCHCSGCQGLVAGVRGEVGSPHKVQEVDLQMLSSLGIKLTSDQGNYRVQSDHGQCHGSEADSGSWARHPTVPSSSCDAINCATAVNSHTWSTVWETGGMGHGTWDTGLDTPHTSHGCSYSECWEGGSGRDTANTLHTSGKFPSLGNYSPVLCDIH